MTEEMEIAEKDKEKLQKRTQQVENSLLQMNDVLL